MSKHRGPRNTRRRAVSLAGAVLLSGLVGVAGVTLAPQLRSDAAPARTTPAVIETQTLAAIASPVAKQVEPIVPAVPRDSGDGKRIVFDQSDQRVWLVAADDSVARTYLVSGSRFDNLQPGDYRVQSKTRHATAFDASGTMEYFVRFATGYSEPIGFHTVPKDNAGRLEQTRAQLGTPLSAGCVRQWPDDAIALWDFAPVGTPVTVLA